MKDYSEKLVDFAHVSPTFFIGLGGSGSDVVNRIAEKLSSRWDWEQKSKLIHFFAFDTNTHDLQKQEHIARENRILISDFDKRSYVNQKRGEGHTPEDTYLTDWVHDWYEFRGTRGAGAGQIRIESRLSLYYQLENDRGRIIQRLNAAANTARHHDNPYRRNDPPHFQVFIYGSIAGGTGSGSFIPMAYLTKEIIEGQGWIPKVFGTLITPSLFLNEVPGALHLDINANGYAALKELEHLMKLGAEGAISSEAFHYNPNNTHQSEVDDKPFDFIYLADKPTKFEIGEYKNAIADAAYLLLYSPIIGAQASDYDNYEKHQKGLVSGYTVYYGSNGCSVLILPDEDILEYCALRFAGEAMREYLLFQQEGSEQFAINFDDPKFARMSEEAQNEAIDEKFAGFISYMARQEEKDEIENGPYQATDSLLTPSGGSLLEALERRISDFASEVSEQVTFSTLNPVSDVTEHNYSVDGYVNTLRKEINEVKTKIRSIWDGEAADIKSGDALNRFFEEFKADPFKQRLFLIRAKDWLKSQIEELSTGSNPYDLDAAQVRDRIEEDKERLKATVEHTLKEKLMRDGNADFNEARGGFVEYFNDKLVEGNRKAIIDTVRLDYARELLESFESRLDAFRSVASESLNAIEAVDKEAEDARKTGRFAHGEGRSNAFILDVEALDEVGGERLWHFFWEDRFVRGGKARNTFDRSAIFRIINEAFSPRIDDKGRKRKPTHREITDQIKNELIALGRKTLAPEIVGTRDGGTDLTQRGLLLEDALLYEARYHFERQFRADNKQASPTDEQIDGYIKSKLQFCENKANPLATFGNVEDPNVVNSRSALVGLHSAYRDRLEPMLEEIVPYAQRIANWQDEKSIVFYNANLGVPLFYYQRVTGGMKRDYNLVMKKPPAERGYPIHIDSRWEDSLPSLDPNDAASGDREDRERNRMVDYGVGFVSGVLRTTNEGGVVWTVGGVEGALGDDAKSAFDALDKLDDRTSRRVQGAIDDARRKLESEKDPNVASRLTAYLETLDETIWKLEQRNEPTTAALEAFLKKQEETLKEWIDETGLPV